MKKSLLFLTLGLTFSFVGCNNEASSSENPVFQMNIENFVANIQDARGLGIQSASKLSPKQRHRKNASDDPNEFVLIKTTTDYAEGDVSISDGKIEEVTFTKIDTTVKTKEIVGEDEYIAHKKEEDDQFGYVSFKAYEGFEYTIKAEENILFPCVKDNDENDADKMEGLIRIEGLEDGMSYKVSYKGLGEETIISQSEVGATIDKMYVYNEQFTFVSYVPENTSNRPTGKKLIIEDDGISTYDKGEYFSSNKRSTFILDNYSGLIYKFAGSHTIWRFDGNLLYINQAMNDYNTKPYDFYINENNELVLERVCLNETLGERYAVKDKYGYKFVINEKINQFDESSKTTFYVSKYFIGEKNSSEYEYYLTNTNEVVRFPFSRSDSYVNESKTMDIHIGNNEWRPINENDSFKVYKMTGNQSGGISNEPTMVKNGYLIRTVPKEYLQGWYEYFPTVIYNDEDCTKTISLNFYSKTMNTPASVYCNVKYLSEYDIVFIYFNGNIYFMEHHIDAIRYVISQNAELFVFDEKMLLSYGEYRNTIPYPDQKIIQLIIENVVIEEDKIISYGINGNTEYEIIVEKIGDEITIKPYVSGTYVPPTKESELIVFQPINK